MVEGPSLSHLWRANRFTFSISPNRATAPHIRCSRTGFLWGKWGSETSVCAGRMQWGWDAYVGGRARQPPLITVCTTIVILSHHLDPRCMWQRNHASPCKPTASAAFRSDSWVQPRRLNCPPSHDGDLASGGARQWCLHHPYVHHFRVSEDYGDMVVDGRRRAWKPPTPTSTSQVSQSFLTHLEWGQWHHCLLGGHTNQTFVQGPLTIA